MASTITESFTIEEKRRHVSAYIKSNLTRAEYCRRNGLKLTSFKNWATKYGRKRKNGFVSVISTPQPQSITPHPPNTKQQRIEITKGNCKVVLCDVVNAASVVEAIKGVLLCN